MGTYQTWMVVYQDDRIAHHGILGMKWGVRRYQNYDGTRTPLGKRLLNNEKSNARTVRNSIDIAKYNDKEKRR